MKQYIIITLIAAPLYAAEQKAIAGPAHKEPFKITSNLKELSSTSVQHARNKSLTKAGVSGISAAAIVFAAKTPLAKELVPQIVRRDGTLSNIVSVLAIATAIGGGAWAVSDYFRAWGFAHDAQHDMGTAIHELQETQKEISELKKLFGEQTAKMEDIDAQMKVVKIHARTAKENMEKTATDIETLIAGIKEDWGNAAHKQDIQLLAKRMNELDTLVQQMALSQLQQGLDKEPNLDEMLGKIASLETASKKFAQVSDAEIKTKYGADAPDKKTKKSWRRPWKH